MKADELTTFCVGRFKCALLFLLFVNSIARRTYERRDNAEENQRKRNVIARGAGERPGPRVTVALALRAGHRQHSSLRLQLRTRNLKTN